MVMAWNACDCLLSRYLAITFTEIFALLTACNLIEGVLKSNGPGVAAVRPKFQTHLYEGNPLFYNSRTCTPMCTSYSHQSGLGMLFS